jgi:N6-L-threonylcarbamoyladenine synthase
MTILGIETSCDETAAAVVQDGHIAQVNTVATSLDQHQITGGIVPEVAARAQVEYIIPVLQKTLGTASSSSPPLTTENLILDTISTIDAIAVTVGPGLIGSLLVGVETAKMLAYAWQKPLIPVNHMLGHIYGAWLSHDDLDGRWPKLALLVSGGHSELILMKSHQDIKKVGWTLDDAAGEAFDKVAKLLGLNYPGGPNLSKLAQQGDAKSINFPLPLNQKDNFNFSFSGLKTAVLNYTRENPKANKADIAASFQQTVVTSLVNKTKLAAEHFNVQEVILGGGVAANTLLRNTLVSSLAPLPCQIPDLPYTTDNAAVIAAAAFYHNHPQDPLTVQANTNLELPG